MTTPFNASDAIVKVSPNREPFNHSRFDVEFLSVNLTQEQKDNLKNSIVSIRPGMIEFAVTIESNPFTIGKISPIDELLAIIKDQAPSNIVINLQSKDGSVVSSIIYKKCTFELDLNNILSLTAAPSYFGLDFDTGNVGTSVYLSFRYESVCLNQTEINV